MNTLQIRLFARAEFTYGDDVIAFRAPARALSLLGYLLVHAGSPLMRDAVAFTLWPEESEADARAQLRRHLYYINETLPAAPEGVPWICADKRSVQWNPRAPFWCDVVAFTRGVDDSASAASVASLYRGDLLEGIDDDWLQGPREHFREQQLRLLLKLIEASREQGDYVAGIAYAKSLLTVDPWREDALRALIALRHASGDRAGALTTYRDFSKRLFDELGVEPMPETTAEYERVLAADEAAVIPLPSRVTESLANPEALRLTPSFTGREAELGAIEHALWNDNAITTLYGLGGVGKSAIAREYARRNRARYQVTWSINAEDEASIVDGLVRLGAQLLPDIDRMSDRCAAAMNVLTNVLPKLAKPVLLLYDNLGDERLLRVWAADNAHILVTSRHAVWSTDVAAVRVDSWTLDESICYFKRASARGDIADAQICEIAQTLGCLPLAMAHAAAYLKLTPNVTARRYIEWIGEHLTATPRGAEYDRAVLATFCEAIRKAEEDAPGALELLVRASFFSPNSIPEELLTLSGEGGNAALRTDDALGTLHRLSLLVFSPDTRTYALHRLVQHAGRHLASHQPQLWAQDAVVAVDAVFPEVTGTNSAYCERLLPHARAALAALDAPATFEPAARLAKRCGQYLAKRDMFAAA